MAWGAIEAYKIIGDPSYLRFALDQYNWILGANYYRVCMMEAAGDYHVNKYHTRYDTFITNGIEPGVVTNGYIRDRVRASLDRLRHRQRQRPDQRKLAAQQLRLRAWPWPGWPSFRTTPSTSPTRFPRS